MEKTRAVEWLKAFIQEIDTQDNRATAKPIQLLLQTKREYVSHPDYNYRTRTVFRHHRMEGDSEETHEACVKWLEEYGYEGEELEKKKQDIEEFQMGHYWETNQMFFTEKGLKEHIAINGHNLKDTRDYVVHSFRNPEMTELFQAIRAIIL